MIFSRFKDKRSRAVIYIIAAFILANSPVLFSAYKMFTHDSIWFYGIFHYFAESLINGIFPYWDPYDYCGQPFYTNLSIMHLYNPIALAVIFSFKVLKISLLTLYHWYYFILIIVSALGVYRFTRENNAYGFTGLLCLVLFLFSSFPVICMRQAGFLFSFLWVPWAMCFIMRLVKNPSPANYLGVVFFMGLAMGGYQGLLLVVYAAIFILTLAINKRGFFQAFMKNKAWQSLAGGAVVLLLLCGPLLSVFIEKNDFVPLARIRTSRVESDSYTNHTGCVPAVAGDFKGLVMRDVAVKGYFEKGSQLSEGFLHIGLIGLMLAILGAVFSRDDYKINFILSTAALALLMLGPHGFLQNAVNTVFPPFKYVRHMQLYAGFFIFNLIYFAGKGADMIAYRLKGNPKRTVILFVLIAAVFAEMILYTKDAVPYVVMDRPIMKFSEMPLRPGFAKRRQARQVSSDYFRYFRPVLYKKNTVFNSATVPAEFLPPGMHYDIFTLYDMAFKGTGAGAVLDLRSKNMKEALESGFGLFSTFGKEEKLYFLDVLNCILFDVIRNRSYYYSYNGLLEDVMAARGLVVAGYKDVAAGAASWALIDGAKKYFTKIIALDYPVKAAAKNTEFVFMGKKYTHAKRAVVHIALFAGIPGSEYLEYVWVTNHVEEFTLVLSRYYRDFLEVLDTVAKDKKRAALENIEAITGVTRDIILFYPEARIMEDKDILAALSGDRDAASGLSLDKAWQAAPKGNTDLPAGGKNFSYRVRKFDTNSLHIECSFPTAGYLLYSDGYNRHWKAFVDGKSAGISRANTVFKAVAAGAGRHEIVFTYDPLTFQWALALYYTAILAALLIYVFAAVRGVIRKE